MFAHDVEDHKKKKKGSVREDSRIEIEGDSIFTELTEETPLLTTPKAQTANPPLEQLASVTTLTAFPTDVWDLIIPHLSIKDINNLRRSNPIVRRRINSALDKSHHSQRVSTLLTLLRNNKDAYFGSEKLKSKKFEFYILEAVLAETACILAASLPINNFQSAYVSTFQNMSQSIMNESSLAVTWAKNAYGWCYVKSYAWDLPANCIFNCASNYITDGPAGYWFVGLITANAAYVTARASLSIPFAKYPRTKITIGLMALSLGGLAISLPVIANQGWSESSAIRSACCLATQCGLYGKKYQSQCQVGTRTYSVESFCFKGIEMVTPLIPVLAEVSPLILTGATVGALLAVGLWAYRKAREFNTADQDIDPFNELSKRHHFSVE